MINMVHTMEVEGITIVRTPLTQLFMIQKEWQAYDAWMHSSLEFS